MNEFMTNIQSVDWLTVFYFFISGILLIWFVKNCNGKGSFLGLITYIVMILAYCIPAIDIFWFRYIYGILVFADLRLLILIIPACMFFVTLDEDIVWGFVLSLVPILGTALINMLS
jgi:hypothetical protein